MLETVITIGSLAFAVYSWWASGKRDTNHRIALALTAGAVDVNHRVDDILLSGSNQARLEALQTAIRRFEEAYLEARAAWGIRMCRPASDLHHYAGNFAGACAGHSGVPSDMPELYISLAEVFGVVGTTWFHALSGDTDAKAVVLRHMSALLARVEEQTTPHLRRPLGADDDSELPVPEELLRKPSTDDLDRIVAAAESHRLPPGRG